MLRFLPMMALALGAVVLMGPTTARAEPCMLVTLTGTQGGPPIFKGNAGAGTLVRYGDSETNCSDVKLQFDTGRGTNMRLSELGVPPGQLNAIFFTHMHSDHTEGLSDILQLRWHFNSKGPKVDIVCNEAAKSPLGFTLSCDKLVAHIGDPFIESGEISQRRAENEVRLPGGPADLANVMTFAGQDEPVEVWRSDDVVVSAVRSRHIPGHASYRVDTPAGSVVIGGDAGNDTPAPPRDTSTSAQVERLADGVDVIVHSTIHPVMGPDKDSGFPPPIYYRQSAASDLGSMADRAGAKYLMLTHLIPPIGAAKQGPYPIPGGAPSADDYVGSVTDSGFTGETIVGPDLTTLRLPAE